MTELINLLYILHKVKTLANRMTLWCRAIDRTIEFLSFENNSKFWKNTLHKFLAIDIDKCN